MKKLLLVAAIATGLYFGWKRFGSSVGSGESQATPADHSERTTGANAQKRIDALSGAAPAE
jgi:hypothetical protein